MGPTTWNMIVVAEGIETREQQEDLPQALRYLARVPFSPGPMLLAELKETAGPILPVNYGERN